MFYCCSGSLLVNAKGYPEIQLKGCCKLCQCWLLDMFLFQPHKQQWWAYTLLLPLDLRCVSSVWAG